MRKPKQLSLIKREPSAYGGELRNTRKGRSKPRPLATRETMHLILKSSKTRGAWSFRNPRHMKRIEFCVRKFAAKYDVVIMSMANVGNHLHFQIKLTKRFLYAPFIRAVTGSIAVLVTRADRKLRVTDGGTTIRRSRTIESAGGVTDGRKTEANTQAKLKFWDHRPFTRVVHSLKAVLNLKDYIRVNQLEGEGYHREDARMIIEIEKDRQASSG